MRDALEAGFTMVTVDVSDFLKARFLTIAEDEVTAVYTSLDAEYRLTIEDRYLGKSSHLDCGQSISFTASTLKRIALAFESGINHAVRLYNVAKTTIDGKAFDFELSIDETDVSTSPEAHLFVAQECLHKGVRLTSLAPSFVGEFQKAIDFIGNFDKFDNELIAHSSIAKLLGYRLSIHSGSDKYSVFPSIGRITNGVYHLKISGTNWLEGISLIANQDPVLFRVWFERAIACFAVARTSYHVTPDLTTLPQIEKLADQDLQSLLDHKAARQVLHITYGEILKDPTMRAKAFEVFNGSVEIYQDYVSTNLERHLESLRVPLRTN